MDTDENPGVDMGDPISAERSQDFDAACRQAFLTAARRLNLDAGQLASRCAEGELAELILELRMARHALSEADRERVEALLRRIGLLP
ncbi:MAG TPA: hypothetical protein VIL13_12005 [Longimicrobiales bacterium]